MVSTQPKTTSSTAPGSTPVRWIRAVRAWPPRSAGWTWARPPPRRPTGVRTASTMNASATVMPLSGHDHAGAVAEQALVDGEADGGTLDLAPVGLAAQLPGQLADLGDGLGGDGLAE